MRTNVSVICYKSKTLANGEHPLMLRISQSGKSTYKSLGLSVQEKDWDFKKNTPKLRCPNKDIINKIVLKIKLKFENRILNKQAMDEEFTALSLINEEKDEIKAKTVEEFCLQIVKELEDQGRIGNSRAYYYSYNMMRNFNKGKKLDFTFSRIDVAYCQRFEDWLRAKGDKDTTISYQLRTLRAIYNRAIRAKIVARDKNPFIEFTLSHLNTKTPKRALSKEDIMRIISMNCSGEGFYRELAHDLFVFSYLCGEISFVDIANLTAENIVEGRLMYQRQKTHNSINLLLCDKAKKLIEKYSSYYKKARYLFPILDYRVHVTPVQKYDRAHKICHRVNQELKEIARILNIEADVTTYVARHSFATILKKSGVNIGIISQALGHQDIKTTEIYLSKFDNEQVDEAMKNLL